MNTLIDSDWGYLILSDFVDYAYYLGWGVIALVALCLVLKYIAKPLMSECFQQKAKKNAFEQDKFWEFFNRMEKPLKEELEKTKNELAGLKKKEIDLKQEENDLKQEERDLQEKKSALEKERNEFEKTILEAKLKAYEEIIKNLD